MTNSNFKIIFDADGENYFSLQSDYYIEPQSDYSDYEDMIDEDFIIQEEEAFNEEPEVFFIRGLNVENAEINRPHNRILNFGADQDNLLNAL